MSRCVEFSNELFAEILTAYKKTMTKFRLVCERENGKMIDGRFEFNSPDGLQRLADALNRRFSRRRYYVESIEVYKLPIIRKVA